MAAFRFSTAYDLGLDFHHIRTLISTSVPFRELTPPGSLEGHQWHTGVRRHRHSPRFSVGPEADPDTSNSSMVSAF
jgi:hypothetical protein